MNRSLFVSIHLAVGGAVAAACVAWMVMGGHAPGRGAGSDPTFLLWTGWLALAMYLVVVLYSLRKYAHKLGISPELKMKVPLDRLERTEKGLNDVRRQILSGALASERDILDRGNSILREHGAHKIMKLRVRAGGEGEASFAIDVVPTDPLGRMAKWLHAHLYYGLAAAVIVWLHGGGSLDFSAHPMGFLLNLTSLIVILTGLVGVVLWAIGPAMMSRAETDLSVEEAFVIEETIGQKIERVLAKMELEPAMESIYRDVMRAGSGYPRRAKEGLAALEQKVSDATPDAGELRDLMALVGQYAKVKLDLAGMLRVKMLMNWWRAIHVPVSIFLMGLLVVHVVSVWWY